MNRRNFLQSAAVGGAIAPRFALAQDSDGGFGTRELVVHTVHDGLRKSSPLEIYTGLARFLGPDPILEEVAGTAYAVEVWNDWNDHDLRQVFGAFTVGTPDIRLGSYRIFDTPDIAHGVHQPIADEIERGYIPVAGYRASFMDAEGIGWTRMRLWNVIIDGVAIDKSEASDVMLGLVKHLGRAIGAIDQVSNKSLSSISEE